MKKYLITLLLSSLLFACNEEKKLTKDDLKTDTDKLSYSIGMDMGRNLKKQGTEINEKALSQGLKDFMQDAKPLLTEEEIKTAFENFRKQMTEKRGAEAAQAGEKNRKEGEDFLAKKKTEEGVKSTKSGLLYKVVKEGTGKQPKLTNKVRVHYKGTLINGTEFDSSYKRNEPVEFQLGQVIKGWQEGVQLMKEGAKYELYIPSDLAYGKNGAGKDIGPDSTLIFEVELLKIVG